MKSKRALLLVLTLMVLSLVSVSTVFATTYYVKNGGNDSLSGTSDANAWAHAPGMYGWTGSATISPGDTVLFNRGDTWTFSGSSNGTSYAIPTSGTAAAPIYYGAYGTGNRPVFNGNGIQEWYGMISLTGISYVTIDNWELTNGQDQLMQVWGPNSTGVIVQNSVFHDNTQPGYQLVEVEGMAVGGVTQITFNNNLFYNGQHDGLKFNDGVTYATVSNNVFHDIQHNSFDTLSMKTPGYVCSNFTVYGNDIYAGINSGGADGMYIPGLVNSVIYGNTIHDFAGVGIQSDAQVFPTQNVTIRNNVLWNLSGTGNYALWFTGGNSGINIWNNTIYNCNSPDIDDGGESFANNLAYDSTKVNVNSIKDLGSNPMFVNPTGTPPDFHLQAGSPAIDAGVNVGLPYSGSAPDLGAFEYTGTTAQPPAAPSGLRILS